MIEYKFHSAKHFQRYKMNSNKNDVFLTGLIMVKNQEKNIINAIKSIQKYCDLLVIVDTGSTDKTVENIESLALKNLKLYKMTWVENYAYMRNKCLSLVPDGWILVLDSDEEFDSKICDATELKNFLGLLNQKNNPVCTVKTINYDDTAFTRKRVLFRKSSSICYHGLVHEELTSVDKTALTVIDTNLSVINKGVVLSEIQKFKKPERYSRLLIKQMNLEPNNPRWLAMISQDYIDLGLISKEQYIEKLRKFIFKEKVDDFSVKNIQFNEWSKYLLARYILVWLSLGDFDKASQCAKTAIKLFPNDVNFLTLYASSINAINSILADQAVNYIKHYLKQGSQNWDEVQEESQGTIYSIKPMLAKLLITEGKYDQASEILNQIDNSKAKQIVYDELRYFRMKKTR